MSIRPIDLDVAASTATLARLARTGELLIDGTWASAASGETLPVVDPASDATIGAIAAAGPEDVDRAARAARAAVEDRRWRRIPPATQGAMLADLADRIDADAELLAELEAIDAGKPITAARVEVAQAAAFFRYYAGWPTKIYGTTNPTPPDVLGYTRREPIGVCAGIIPWNCPLINAAYKIAPALACGNVVILKPAEQTSLTALRLGELIAEAGFPPAVVQILTGLGEVVGRALVDHAEIDKIAFTGSTEVGHEIARRGAGTLKQVTLELGGKSPAIVFPDADLDQFAAQVLSPWGVWYGSGQICAANTRFLVHRDVLDQVAEATVASAAQLLVGPPLEPTTQLGPLVSDEQLARVLGYLDVGRDEGAEVLAGAGRLGTTGCYVGATVLGGVSPTMRVAREEIFGPVVGLIPFDDDAEAVRLANVTDYGLTASVWTNDIRRGHRVADAIDAGVVWLNTYGDTDPVVPFGGVKASGYGRECGEESIRTYTRTKSVYCRVEPLSW